MTQKDFVEIQTFLSSTRLNTYGQNLPVKKQLKEYRRNIKLCRNFYSELDFFEVTLRNAIDSALTSFVNGARLSKEVVEEVVKNRVDYLCENASIKYGVYTDDEDVTYNRLVFNKESEL